MSGTRASAYTNQTLGNLSLTMPLNTPLKLASMLSRLPHPARLTMLESKALIEADSLRCTFPASPQGLPQLDFDGHLKRCANSTWRVSLDDLQKLWGVISTIARENSEIDLSISEINGGATLLANLEEADSNARYEMNLERIPPDEESDADHFRGARILFSDLKKAMERVVGQPRLSMTDKAVILTDICESDERHYFIGNRDTGSA